MYVVAPRISPGFEVELNFYLVLVQVFKSEHPFRMWACSSFSHHLAWDLHVAPDRVSITWLCRMNEWASNYTPAVKRGLWISCTGSGIAFDFLSAFFTAATCCDTDRISVVEKMGSTARRAAFPWKFSGYFYQRRMYRTCCTTQYCDSGPCSLALPRSILSENSGYRITPNGWASGRGRTKGARKTLVRQTPWCLHGYHHHPPI